MITGLLAIGLMVGFNFAQAQTIGAKAGTLDPTFGVGGIVTTNFGGVSVSPLTAIEQSNGNIAVVAGLGNGIPNEEDFALVRYTSNGTLIGTTKAAFFTDGINSPTALTVQSNGDIVVVGTASLTFDGAQEFAIARFTPNGQLDATFGTGGLVTTDISGPDQTKSNSGNTLLPSRRFPPERILEVRFQ
jgi:uncharacterized delta-60 repeat protein